MIVIGIDGGLSGYIAVIGQGSVITHPIPTIKIKGRAMYNPAGIDALIFTGDEPGIVFVETMTAMPGKFGGALANFSRGYFMGMIETILALQSCKREYVRPRTWQKIFGIGGKGADTKRQSIQIASRLFPKESFETERGRLLDGKADALLIAEYGRRIML